MKRYWMLTGVSVLVLAGCRTDPPSGRTYRTYDTHIGKHPFQLRIEDETYEFYQFGYDKFPHFHGKCIRLERTDEYEKVLGLTGLTNPPVIFFRISRKQPNILELEAGVRFSYDDKTYFDNGWEWLKANPNQATDRDKE